MFQKLRGSRCCGARRTSVCVWNHSSASQFTGFQSLLHQSKCFERFKNHSESSSGSTTCRVVGAIEFQDGASSRGDQRRHPSPARRQNFLNATQRVDFERLTPRATNKPNAAFSGSSRSGKGACPEYRAFLSGLATYAGAGPLIRRAPSSSLCRGAGPPKRACEAPLESAAVLTRF